MKITLEVRAYLEDDYGHIWPILQVEPDRLAELRKGHEDMVGCPCYFTVVKDPDIDTFPKLAKFTTDISQPQKE